MSEVGSEKGDKRRWFRRGREESDPMIVDEVETGAAPEVEPGRSPRRTKRSGDMFRGPATQDTWSATAWEDDWDDDWNESPKRTSVRAAAAPSAAKVDAWLESDSNDFADSTRDIAKKWASPDSNAVPEPGAFWDDDPAAPVVAEPVFTADPDEVDPDQYDRPVNGALGDLDDTGAWHVDEVREELARSIPADRSYDHLEEPEEFSASQHRIESSAPAPVQQWSAPEIEIDDQPDEQPDDQPEPQDTGRAFSNVGTVGVSTGTRDEFDLSEFASDGDLDFDDDPDDFAPETISGPAPLVRAVAPQPAPEGKPRQAPPVEIRQPKVEMPVEPQRPSFTQPGTPVRAERPATEPAAVERPTNTRPTDVDPFDDVAVPTAPPASPSPRVAQPPQRSTKPVPVPVLHDDFADQDVEFSPIDYSESNSARHDRYDDNDDDDNDDDDFDGAGSSTGFTRVFGQSGAFSKLCSASGAGLLIIGSVRLLVMLMTSAIATKDEFDVIHRIGLGFNDIGSSFGLLFLLGIVLISLPTVIGDDQSEHYDSRAATLLGIAALACLLGVVGGIIGVRSTIQQLNAQEISVDNADWTNFIHTLLSTTGVSLVALLAAVRAISARGNE